MNMVLLTLSAIPLLAWELYFIVFAVVGAWAASDARDRGMKAGAQATVFVGILLLGIIGVIVWFLVRPARGRTVSARPGHKSHAKAAALFLAGTVMIIAGVWLFLASEDGVIKSASFYVMLAGVAASLIGSVHGRRE